MNPAQHGNKHGARQRIVRRKKSASGSVHIAVLIYLGHGLCIPVRIADIAKRLVRCACLHAEAGQQPEQHHDSQQQADKTLLH